MGSLEARETLNKYFTNLPAITDSKELDKHKRQAIRFFEDKAKENNPFCQSFLGLMYQNSWGVKQDYAEAVKWFRLSAEQGNANGQFNLGAMYDNGQGVKQDYAEAVKWYRL